MHSNSSSKSSFVGMVYDMLYSEIENIALILGVLACPATRFVCRVLVCLLCVTAVTLG